MKERLQNALLGEDENGGDCFLSQNYSCCTLSPYNVKSVELFKIDPSITIHS